MIPVSHVIRGRVDETYEVEHAGAGLITPRVRPGELVWSRHEPFPALDLSTDEVIGFLAAVGRAMDVDTNAHMQAALDSLVEVNPLGRRTIEGHYRSLHDLFDPDVLRFEYEQTLGRFGDGWQAVTRPDGSVYEQRWFPSRTVHVLPGNGARGSLLAFVRTALVRGVALLKLPSNDPFTAVAVLKTMAGLDPQHPVTQSFSAVYWRGGDERVESVLFRAQFFDKLIAWGGEGSIRNAIKYIGPGFELVSFDPKTAISIIGEIAHSSPTALAQVAAAAADDVGYQSACSSSRYQFVQGSAEQVDVYCAALLQAMHEYHERERGRCIPTPKDLIDEVDALRSLDPLYRVWGNYDGTGLVVRSDEPVEFYPDARTVDVVRVDNLADVLEHVTIATQTVGIYPPEQKPLLRDVLANAGADRVCNLGEVGNSGDLILGRPHDGMLPLMRFPRWIYSQP